MTRDPKQPEPGTRLMRRLAAAMTPTQRMERMAQLEKSCFALLGSCPEAFARFWRRNLRKRAVRIPHEVSRPR